MRLPPLEEGGLCFAIQIAGMVFAKEGYSSVL